MAQSRGGGVVPPRRSARVLTWHTRQFRAVRPRRRLPSASPPAESRTHRPAARSPSVSPARYPCPGNGAGRPGTLNARLHAFLWAALGRDQLLSGPRLPGIPDAAELADDVGRQGASLGAVRNGAASSGSGARTLGGRRPARRAGLDPGLYESASVQRIRRVAWPTPDRA